MTTYDERYFQFIEQASLDSARGMLPVVQQLFQPRSVVDFGCGYGAWLRVWKELNVSDVLGADGDYVSTQSLLIDQSEFRAVDLTKSCDLGRNFDLASCLEVGEHLPATAAPSLVETLTRHSKVVLFSAAVPGQGGYCHINEQPPEYWRALFASRQYCMLDVIRPRLLRLSGVEPWYAYNTFVFVEQSVLGSLAPGLVESMVSTGGQIRDYSPLPFRIRKAVLRQLSVGMINALHTVKKHCILSIKDLRERRHSGFNES